MDGNPAKVIVKLKNAIVEQATNVKLIYASVEQVDARFRTIATAIISYTKENKRRVVYARFIAELLQPVCSGYKYAVDATNRNEKDIIKQLKEFAEEQTRIVYYGHAQKMRQNNE